MYSFVLIYLTWLLTSLAHTMYYYNVNNGAGNNLHNPPGNVFIFEHTCTLGHTERTTHTKGASTGSTAT